MGMYYNIKYNRLIGHIITSIHDILYLKLYTIQWLVNHNVIAQSAA